MSTSPTAVRRDPKFSDSQIEQICAVLGATSTGLTGSEISAIFESKQIPDPAPTDTKRYRMFVGLRADQEREGCGNPVLRFIAAAMAPVRYSQDRFSFDNRRDRLNTVLAFYGLSLREDGRFARHAPASTLSEASQRANRLRSELERRGVSPDVLRFCLAELLQDNCFHAVFEATKSVADKIRQRSGLTSDGNDLVDGALGGKAPRLRINAFATDTEAGEQRGFANLVKGMFGTFRNVTAHAPRIAWPISEEDALDLFSLASYVHRRLDRAIDVRT